MAPRKSAESMDCLGEDHEPHGKRKSSAIDIYRCNEYFMRADQGRPDILELFQEDVEVYFPKFGFGFGRNSFLEMVKAFEGALELSRRPRRQRQVQYRLRCDIMGDVIVVADTDVIVAAMRSPGGASAAILRAARRSKITLLVSVPLAVEYEATCSEAEHRLAAGLSEREVEIFLDAVMAMAEPVKTHFLWRPQLRDPGDEMVLETAVNGRADGLVTFNVRDFGTVPARFGIELMIPREVLGRMRR